MNAAAGRSRSGATIIGQTLNAVQIDHEPHHMSSSAAKLQKPTRQVPDVATADRHQSTVFRDLEEELLRSRKSEQQSRKLLRRQSEALQTLLEDKAGLLANTSTRQSHVNSAMQTDDFEDAAVSHASILQLFDVLLKSDERLLELAADHTIPELSEALYDEQILRDKLHLIIQQQCENSHSLSPQILIQWSRHVELMRSYEQQRHPGIRSHANSDGTARAESGLQRRKALHQLEIRKWQDQMEVANRRLQQELQARIALETGLAEAKMQLQAQLRTHTLEMHQAQLEHGLAVSALQHEAQLRIKQAENAAQKAQLAGKQAMIELQAAATKQVEDVRLQFSLQLRDLQQHLRDLQQQLQQQSTAHDEQVLQLQSKHEQAISELLCKMDTELKQQLQYTSSELETLRTESGAKLLQVTSAHEAETAGLQQSHEEQLLLLQSSLEAAHRDTLIRMSEQHGCQCEKANDLLDIERAAYAKLQAEMIELKQRVLIKDTRIDELETERDSLHRSVKNLNVSLTEVRTRDQRSRQLQQQQSEQFAEQRQLMIQQHDEQSQLLQARYESLLTEASEELLAAKSALADQQLAKTADQYLFQQQSAPTPVERTSSTLSIPSIPSAASSVVSCDAELAAPCGVHIDREPPLQRSRANSTQTGRDSQSSQEALQPILLPPHWKTHTTDDGEAYYHNVRTQQSIWVAPLRENLSASWTEMRIGDAVEYYNTETGVKSRLFPDDGREQVPDEVVSKTVTDSDIERIRNERSQEFQRIVARQWIEIIKRGCHLTQLKSGRKLGSKYAVLDDEQNVVFAESQAFLVAPGATRIPISSVKRVTTDHTQPADRSERSYRFTITCRSGIRDSSKYEFETDQPGLMAAWTDGLRSLLGHELIAQQTHAQVRLLTSAAVDPQLRERSSSVLTGMQRWQHSDGLVSLRGPRPAVSTPPLIPVVPPTLNFNYEDDRMA
eukprot:TRINITY_DN10228_c0_g1_i1.p1 TRINITY_DN10228_c0_g1~~TRINITY_DN10228_c0_g1_i1.p1  ORF type:complete len:955 (+),score=179.60 TRINITY_DN10228_c0_g1_i1:157-3021(+)